MGTYGTDIQTAMTAQIKAEIAARDWKQSELSKRSGIPTSSLSRYLNGEREMSLNVFADIAEALGLSILELVGRAQRRLDGENVQ